MTNPLPVKIHVGPTAQTCRVEVNGQDLTRFVTSCTVALDVRKPTRLTLELLNVDVEIEGLAYADADRIDTRTYAEAGKDGDS